jgi:cysteinyl-tRNA synthetase
LVLHNTLTRLKEPFAPLDPDHVRLYVCGPTVYQRIHVGNARPLIVFDVLFRLLRHLYPEVTYVRNITDVDDKIIAQAKENGEPIEALTSRTTEAFLADAAALGCLEPTLQPKATNHIQEMVALIGRLIEAGHAYEADGHVLFHTLSMPAYGRLSGRNRDDQIAGARVEVAPYKRDPADFILWKPAADGEPGWDSPWGRGRPGWHIECSAMAEKHLGVPFDIHGGGQDLIFPHHENEMAQTCCAHGLDTMARFWLHNGFVDMRGQKMSKSLGNVLRIDEALEAVPGEAVRLWMLGAHYRAPIDCSEQGFEEAKTQLDRFYAALERAGIGGDAAPEPALIEALEDDLNTPKALAVLHDLLGQLNRARHGEAPEIAARLKASAGLLGLLQQAPHDWLRGSAGADEGTIEALIAERLEARKAKDFARADAIRDQLAQDGIILEDGPAGTTWRRS